MKEIWKVVYGFPDYEVSTFGRLRRGGRLLGSKCKRSEYIKCSLCNGGIVRNTSIHRVVAETFIPNVDMKPCVNHKNCKRSDNRTENLEWCFYSENNNYGDIQLRHSESIKGHPKFGSAGKPMKSVLQIEGTSYVGYFESCQEASRKTGVNDRHINECCLFKRKSAGGYLWRRDLDYSLYSSMLAV